MKRSSAILLTSLALLAGVRVSAHHAFAVIYVPDKTQTLAGTVAEFQFRNPHSVVVIDARDETGDIHRWAVEWGSALQLNRSHVSPSTLKPGDRVVITGHPSRMPEDYRLRLRTIARPSDGWTWRGSFE